MKKKDHSGWIAAALIVLIILGAMALSYVATAGILYLIMLAFGQPWFGWRVSFGVWLLLALVSSVFSIRTTKD